MIGWIIVILLFLVVPLLLVFGVTMAILYRIYNRREVALRDEAEAHRRILENTYDRIWAEFKRRGGLNESHRRSFNNIYPDLLNQSIDDDAVLDWLLDCNIDFNPEEYVSICDAIAEDRMRFVSHQTRMMNIIISHRELLNRPFAKMLIRNNTPIYYVPIDTNHERWGRSL